MKFLSPTTDMVFKKLFGSERYSNVIISFLNSVLGRKEGEKIVSVVINNPYNSEKVRGDKLSIVDVCCTDQSGKRYIVEMQASYQEDFPERAQYYSALALSRQLKKGEDYGKTDPVIFIGVLDFNLFETPHYLSHHYLLDSETQAHVLQHLEFHFIELKKFTKGIDQIENAIDGWIYFLKNAPDNRMCPEELKKIEALEDAFFIVEESNWTDAEVIEYEKNLDRERQERSKLRSAIKLERYEIAKAMFKEGLTVDQITKITKLTIEELEVLKNR